LSLASEKIKCFTLIRQSFLSIKDKKSDSFRVLLNMLVVQNPIQECRWGYLVGPLIMPLCGLGFLFAKRSVCCQATSFEFWLTKGWKGPFLCSLRTHFCVWRGSMLYKAFCLVFHGSHSNNCKHIFLNGLRLHFCKFFIVSYRFLTQIFHVQDWN